MSSKSGISSSNEVRLDMDQIALDCRDKLVQCSLVKVKDDEPPMWQSDAMDTLKHCRTISPWSNNKHPVIASFQQMRNNAIKIEKTDDDIIHRVESPNKMKQLCIQVPNATSPANPIWIQDIMRAKAGTSDG